MMKKAYLVLSDGHVFEGLRFGSDRDADGELVFTTGMGGYIETLTDPSYYGQIIMQTFPLIGNYGWIGKDAESGRCCARGYVVRDWCDAPSNFRCEGNIDEYLKSQDVPGIYGVDTREITRIIREHGVMAARITSDADFDPASLADYRIVDAVKSVSHSALSVHPAKGEERHRVTLIDYGAKGNIIRELTRRGCTVTEVPYDSSLEAIMSTNPDGIMLSNGPGDPEECVGSIEVIRQLVGKKPIFGICLGHQLLALAMGGKTVKLKYGHRGANQPVKELFRDRVIITCQNHGYAVVSDSVGHIGKISFVNANDGTCEGIEYPDKSAFSVQFHPEACSGPWDSEWLFDDFISMMGGKR